MRKLCIVSLFFVLYTAFAFLPHGFVNDYSGVLTSDQIVQLEQLAREIEQNTSAELVILIVNDTGELSPFEYRVKIFNEWGIGKENDNGLLILLVPPQRLIEVEVGYGLEGILPDSKVGRFLDQYAIPHLREGDYFIALKNLLNAFGQEINAHKEEIYYRGASSEQIWLAGLIMLLFLIVLFFALAPRFFVPKCPMCRVRMVRESCENLRVGLREITVCTYRCPKCGAKKKVKYESMLILIGGIGPAVGGFGGFGGGHSGGAGASRSW